MARFNNINGINVAYTDAENAVADALATAYPTSSFNRHMAKLRSDRNKLLNDTDYFGSSDQTMSDEMKTYRTELRDITNGITTKEEVLAVTFPTKPEGI